MRAWVTEIIGHPFCFIKKNLYVLGEEMKKIFTFCFFRTIYILKREINLVYLQ